MGSPSTYIEIVFEFKILILHKGSEEAEKKVTGEADPRKSCPPWQKVPE